MTPVARRRRAAGFSRGAGVGSGRGCLLSHRQCRQTIRSGRRRSGVCRRRPRSACRSRVCDEVLDRMRRCDCRLPAGVCSVGTGWPRRRPARRAEAEGLPPSRAALRRLRRLARFLVDPGDEDFGERGEAAARNTASGTIRGVFCRRLSLMVFQNATSAAISLPASVTTGGGSGAASFVGERRTARRGARHR